MLPDCLPVEQINKGYKCCRIVWLQGKILAENGEERRVCVFAILLAISDREFIKISPFSVSAAQATIIIVFISVHVINNGNVFG